MIRRLRWRFVGITMALLSMVLLVVLGAVGFSSYRQRREQSHGAMRMALGREQDAPPMTLSIGRGHFEGRTTQLLPIFTATLDKAGQILRLDSSHVSLEEGLAEEAVAQVLTETDREGILPGLNLRYMREDFPGGTRIAFLDQSYERAAMTELLLQLTMGFFGALLAFFGMSIFLANLALRPVEKAWEQQRQFIADASHELKTPLTVVLASLGLVEAHPQASVISQKTWLEGIRAEANRMRGLIEQMLFLAKADAERLPQAIETLSMSDLVWNAALAFEPVAFELGVSLHSDIGPDIALRGDLGQLRQLVSILLDNACKYAGEKGAVHCRLWLSGDRARLCIRNTGQPIPPDQLERLFERFYRTDEARARSQGGYGLGLSIAQRIVLAHQGKIWATSSPEQGTQFHVSLPLGGKA